MTIDGIPLVGLTAPALLGIAILLLLTGRIVPRAHITDKDKEIERWRLAYEAEREARIVSDNQTTKLLVAVEANRDVLFALLRVLNPRAGLGGPSDEVKEEFTGT